MTIEEYFFKDKGVRLRYPHLPTLKTTNNNKLPIEVSKPYDTKFNRVIKWR